MVDSVLRFEQHVCMLIGAGEDDVGGNGW